MYRATEGNQLTPEQIARMSQRRMDCVDCHNRPAHIYLPPDKAVDDALAAQRMDATLPYIKKQELADAMMALGAAHFENGDKKEARVTFSRLLIWRSDYKVDVGV